VEPRPQACSGQDLVEFLQCLFGKKDPRHVEHWVKPGSRFP
ncbi:hypothetical protein A2U01_0069748, partial [Trifolium medium]|nr:hypothetical protein [Trifolium medium]